MSAACFDLGLGTRGVGRGAVGLGLALGHLFGRGLGRRQLGLGAPLIGQPGVDDGLGLLPAAVGRQDRRLGLLHRGFLGRDPPLDGRELRVGHLDRRGCVVQRLPRNRMLRHQRLDPRQVRTAAIAPGRRGLHLGLGLRSAACAAVNCALASACWLSVVATAARAISTAARAASTAPLASSIPADDVISVTETPMVRVLRPARAASSDACVAAKRTSKSRGSSSTSKSPCLTN